MTTSISDLAGTVGSAVGDAWSTHGDRIYDLALTVADTATDLATAVVDRAPDVTDKVAGLASSARSRVPKSKPSRSFSPLTFVAAGVIAFLAVGWLLRRRQTNSRSLGVDTSPVRDQTATAARAATN